MDRVLSMLGIATRAGKTACGGFLAEEAVLKGKAYLVITAADAGANTAKRMQDKCSFYKVPHRVYASRDELGRATGKEHRACVAVTDRGLAGNIIDLIDGLREERGQNGENENR